MDDTLGLDNLDPASVVTARAAEAEAGDDWPRAAHGMRPFPFHVKEEVYRHLITESQHLSLSTPVTLCAETLRMWEALGDPIGYAPWDYPCNCGPHYTPHLRRIATVEGPDAERIARAAAQNAVPVSRPGEP